MNSKKRVVAFCVLLLVSACALFIECDVYFPENIRIYQGDSADVPKGFAYTLETAANTQEYGDYDATVKLFGLIPVKDVTVSVEPELTLSPGGDAVGIKLFTKGLICVGTQKITDTQGKEHNPGQKYDIKSGDIIISANGEILHTIERLSDIVSKSQGRLIELVVSQNGKEAKKSVLPINTDDGYKLGLWVRDSTAGIGTITFTDNDSGTFAALGHPITDVDTGKLMPVDKGSITPAEIVGVKKGGRGTPGELYGTFSGNGNESGVITQNTQQGIYGRLIPGKYTAKSGQIPIGTKSQVTTGEAYILSTVNGRQPERFSVEIQRVMRYSPDDKNMIIKITDKRLLDITGGIVQGMSGSPIVQNGKLIGAVTHVFVNDPTRGYGIFIENMLAETEKIK